MFNFFKQKPKGEVIKLKLSGLHCTSCSLNVDSTLEDVPGVISSSTSYAKQETVIIYDPALTAPSAFPPIIASLGYKVYK